MGAQWKHAGRTENASKRGQIMGKMVKEIMVAAKLGGPDQSANSRLRAAVEAAKKQSVPRDTIERGIKRGAGLLNETVNYETIVYEGFAPNKVPVVVECLTENKNRTAADIRVLFRKGQLGAMGAVAWMFDRLGVIEATKQGAGLDIEAAAIEAGAQNVEPLESHEVPAGHTGARIFCDPTDLDSANKALSAMGWTVTLSEMNYIAKNLMELSDEQKKETVEFLNALDDHDDVHRVYTALK